MLIDKVSGYNFSDKLEKINYISAFSSVFEGDGFMKFYAGDPKWVMCGELSGHDHVIVRKYPHNDYAGTDEIIYSCEKKILALLTKLYKETGSRSHPIKFTSDDVVLVTPEDFSLWYPEREIRPEMFMFQRPFEKDGFPHIFYMTKEARIGVEKLLYMYAVTSREVYQPIANQTPLGKKFTYILYNSQSEGKYSSEVISMVGVRFPTRNDAKLPKALNVNALRKFAEEHSDLLTVGKFGKVTENTTPKPVVQKQPEDFVPGFVDENPETEQKKAFVLSQISQFGMVNLTDAYLLGLSETLAILEKPQELVAVQVDIPGFAKKMCFYNGRVHVIPAPGAMDFDFGGYFDEPDEIFQICTEDTYPAFQ